MRGSQHLLQETLGGGDVGAPPGGGFAVNVFLRDGDTVYRTWHTNGRGTEQLSYALGPNHICNSCNAYSITAQGMQPLLDWLNTQVTTGAVAVETHRAGDRRNTQNAILLLAVLGTARPGTGVGCGDSDLTNPYIRVTIRIYGGGRVSAGEHDHPVNPGSVIAARAGVLSVEDAGRLAGLLGMLADPVRSRILFALSATTELCVGDLALALDVTEDQVSYALKMLRLAGLVTFRKDGRMVCYRLSDGFPHRLLEHCLRELLTIAVPEGDR